MYKAYLGSINPVKLSATKKVLIDFDVVGLEVDSEVGNQPMSDEETILGAQNRARALPKGGIRIGLEAGIQTHFDQYFLINWGVLIDEEENIFVAGGTRIPLPMHVIDQMITEQKELAEVMEQETKIDGIKHKDGAIGYYTNSKIKREEIFIHIVKLLYGQYLHKKEKKL